MLFKYRILRITLLLLGIAGIMDTLILTVYSNINVGTLAPGAVGICVIIYIYIKNNIRKGAAVITNPLLRKFIYFSLTLFILSFLLIETLIIYNSQSSNDFKAEYLIILGSGIKGETVTPTLEERLKKGIDYIVRYPGTRVIVSGGQGNGEYITEAEAMKRYLIANGIADGQIIIEDRSTSTMENYKYTKQILTDLTGKETADIMIITSDFHMFRSKMLASRNGFVPHGISCSTPISVKLNCYIREYFAFVKSYIIDK